MTLEKYINGLNELIKKNPEAKDFEVVSFEDDEGNGFSKVYSLGSIGYFNSKERYFIDKDNFEEWLEECGDEGEKLNAVCIN